MAIDTWSLRSVQGMVRTHLSMPLFANAYALIANTVATAGFGMLYWIIAARFYTPDSVGLSAALISAMMFVGGAGQLNLESGIMRFLPLAGQHTARFVTSVYAVVLVTTLVLCVAFLLGIHISSSSLEVLQQNLAMSVWFLVSVMAWSIFHLQDSVLTGLRHAFWIPVENIVFGIAKIVLLILLAGRSDVDGVFASWTIPVILTLVPVNMLIFRRLIPKHSMISHAKMPATRQFVRYVSGDYVGALFFLATTTLLPILVTHEAGARENAYFYQAWLIGYSLQLVAGNAIMSLTVEVARDEIMLRFYSWRILLQTLRLLIPIVLVTLIGAPVILQVFGDDYARHGAQTLRWLSLSALPGLVVLLGIAQARLQQRIREVMLIQAVLCVLIIGLSFPLMRELGIAGVGVAWFTGQTFLALLLLTTRLRWLFSSLARSAPLGEVTDSRT